MRVVLYDCGRLMARATSATPTGIDRVDLRYLDHFLNDAATTVIGVAQKRDALAVYADGGVRAIHRILRGLLDLTLSATKEMMV